MLKKFKSLFLKKCTDKNVKMQDALFKIKIVNSLMFWKFEKLIKEYKMIKSDKDTHSSQWSVSSFTNFSRKWKQAKRQKS